MANVGPQSNRETPPCRICLDPEKPTIRFGLTASVRVEGRWKGRAAGQVWLCEADWKMLSSKAARPRTYEARRKLWCQLSNR